MDENEVLAAEVVELKETIRLLGMQVNTIQARQRASGVHDSFCPAALIARARPVPMLFSSSDCCCWLSQ